MERPPNWRLVYMDRSATWRVAPPGLNILSVLDNRRHRNVSAGECEHLPLSLLIILCVVFDERDTVFGVIIPRPLAVRAVRFYIHYDRHT